MIWPTSAVSWATGLEALAAQAASAQEAVEDAAELHEHAAAHEADDLAREALLPALLGEAALQQEAQGHVVGVQFQAGELALAHRTVLGGGGQLGVAELRAALAQMVQQAAVHHEVRVAAYGRGEVQVGRAGEAEVAHVGGAVMGLLERAQQQVGEGQTTAALAGHGLGHGLAETAVGALQLRRRHGLPRRERRRGHVQLLQGVQQRMGAGRGGRLVHAVQSVRLAAQQELGHGLVGGQHELLHQRVRGRLGPGFGAHDDTAVVEGVLGLERAQREGAARHAAAAQHAGELVRQAKLGHELGVGLHRGAGRRSLRPRGRPVCTLRRGRLALALGDDAVYEAVGEAVVAADERAVELHARAPPLGVEGGLYGEALARFARRPGCTRRC